MSICSKLIVLFQITAVFENMKTLPFKLFVAGNKMELGSFVVNKINF